MSVLVDTSVWSAALRRARVRPSGVVDELGRLIAEGEARMIGPIRQEVLSGIREEAQFERLRERLAAFPDLAIEAEDYELAARFFNRCRRVGVQGSNTDFLICAVAVRHRLAIFTADRDFEHFATELPLVLHRPA